MKNSIFESIEIKEIGSELDRDSIELLILFYIDNNSIISNENLDIIKKMIPETCKRYFLEISYGIESDVEDEGNLLEEYDREFFQERLFSRIEEELLSMDLNSKRLEFKSIDDFCYQDEYRPDIRLDQSIIQVYMPVYFKEDANLEECDIDYFKLTYDLYVNLQVYGRYFFDDLYKEGYIERTVSEHFFGDDEVFDTITSEEIYNYKFSGKSLENKNKIFYKGTFIEDWENKKNNDINKKVIELLCHERSGEKVQ